MVKLKKNESVGGSEQKPEKSGLLAEVLVRISAGEPEYVKMRTEEGWFTATNAPRIPEIHKDVRANLMAAVRAGCALFGIDGGLRVLKGANGKGGVMFIEKKNMTTGKEIFLFSPADKQKCEEAGLKVLRESKGVYVAPRTQNGDAMFQVALENFTNNQSPMGFKLHPWEGYEVLPVEKPKAKKKDKGDGEKGEKKVVKMKEKGKEGKTEGEKPAKVGKKKHREEEGPQAASA